ncbi:3-hydroxyacyl-CoA dehydrogenase [Pseudorhodobacter antarcticus]|uniref:3-hydroxyacyl-CoA dehydrogenase n=1 Tax=Pseudorhodobacter antarcticus TaxID=1077947 RepID=A0A1H8K4L0_9RHOB|nr:enoyl-CoA hydratase-related protein [Pseudorhodobacter antarcticus]SEN87883.1 3-hydroxyacyl-CoA dehydrogenase [Pseudorhodobacter antarcticus]
MQIAHSPSETGPFVTLEPRGAALVLWIDNPPVNALGHGLRAGLAAGIAYANATAPVRAVVLLARGRTFCAGADIAEFGKPLQVPALSDLCDVIEASAKPVIAGLHGTALGGGLELALAAHGRVALADARVGLPEVGLGILPGAGGTQRLPRLIGAEQALRLMISGKVIPAVEGLALGLLDNVVEQNLEAAAIAMALHMTAAGRPVPTRDRRDGMRDPKAYFAAVATARRAQADGPLPGPKRIIDCVEAAYLLPFDQGLAFERAAFDGLVMSPQAVALRHVFFAERRAGRMPGAKAKANLVAQVSVLGSGPDAVMLTRGLLRAGYNVALVDRNATALTDGLEAIALGLGADLAAGQLSQAAHDTQWDLLVPALPGGDGDAADILFVTGAYRLAGAQVPSVSVKAGAPIVTIGRVGDGGSRALGLVLPPPTRNGALAEILVTQGTQDEAIATVLGVLQRMGRLVVQGQGAGLTAGLAQALSGAMDWLEAGPGGQAVIDLMARWGMAQDSDLSKSQALDLFQGDAAPVLGALANAGLRLIGADKALRPSDIDLAMITGLGFPRWGGGPMLWAQERGLLVLRDDLHRWAGDDPTLWTPAPLLDDLIRQGISLADLNDA